MHRHHLIFHVRALVRACFPAAWILAGLFFNCPGIQSLSANSCGARRHGNSTEDRPNIILLMADDLGWGDLSRANQEFSIDGQPHPDQGWVHTPHLDAMARRGIVLNRFYAASPVCSPTRASCLTGMHPHRLGIKHANNGHLDWEQMSLPRLLARAGYRCGHFGKWHLGTLTTVRRDSNRGKPNDSAHYSAPWHHNYHACFATEAKVPTYFPYRKPNASVDPQQFDDPSFYGTYYWQMPDSDDAPAEGRVVSIDHVAHHPDDSELIATKAIEFIKQSHEKNEPFLAVVWFHAPHKPTVDPDSDSVVDSPAALKRSIEDLDGAVGQLRQTLVDLGIERNTLVWFTSDNGPENKMDSPAETNKLRSIRTGGLRMRKRSLYEGGIRVPAIIEWPGGFGSRQSVESNYLASTSDILPTLADLLEQPIPGDMKLDGQSIVPAIRNGATHRADPIGFLFQNRSAWIGQQYKLVHSGSEWELFDLVRDPSESTPLATQSNWDQLPAESIARQTYVEMLGQLNEWKQDVLASDKATDKVP